MLQIEKKIISQIILCIVYELVVNSRYFQLWRIVY